jgi:sortase (surface protein transpeptidase)
MLVAGLLWQLPMAVTTIPKPQVPQVITNSVATPSETKPNLAVLQWRGTATQPKYIALPTIKAQGMLQWVGVDQHNAVAVPNNIHMAGWFTESKPPGDPGLSIIDGHVDGLTAAGIFKNLERLTPNDRFSVTFGDNSQKTFVVRKVVRVPAQEAAGVLFSQEPTIAAQLNLITCGGRFDKTAGGYQDRIIVTASRL